MIVGMEESMGSGIEVKELRALLIRSCSMSASSAARELEQVALAICRRQYTSARKSRSSVWPKLF